MSTPIPEQKSCFLHGDYDEERCPGCARLPRVCSHSIYHHGCPSCDERDPEGNEVCAVCGEIYCPGCELAAAEKVMDPILRRWFAYDCAPHEVGHYAENAAVDLSWALQNAGLLVPHNDALMSEPITPMDGEALANMRHTHRERPSDTAVGYCDECGGHWPCDVATLLARLDVAEADLRSEIEDANELVELFRMALAERDAALASSPEGVVTLNGERFTLVKTDGWQTGIADDGDPFLSMRDDLYYPVPYRPEKEAPDGE
jgi:hypothetical protein